MKAPIPTSNRTQPKIKTLPKDASTNPFDRLANSKKKHEVLNRKVKGENRDVGKSRAKMLEARNSRLLSEINSSKKSNTFNDQRFGENNTSLSIEEKMFLRYQKTVKSKTKNQYKYNLADDDENQEHVLTHGGSILGTNNFNDNEFFSDSEDDDRYNRRNNGDETRKTKNSGELNKDIIDNLHFGGGFVSKNDEDGEDREGGKRNHMTILQEIVAKSKQFKAEKKKLNTENDEMRKNLDDDFMSLLSDNLLEINEKYNKKLERRKPKPTEGEEEKKVGVDMKGDIEILDEYDKLMQEMMYETRHKASDRTKTEEEIAQEEYEKLLYLEQKRLKRMRKLVNNEEEKIKSTKRKLSGDEDEDAEAKAALYSNISKKKIRNDDEIDDGDIFYGQVDHKGKRIGKAQEKKSKYDSSSEDEDEEEDDDEGDILEEEEEEDDEEEDDDEEDDEEDDEDGSEEESDEESDSDVDLEELEAMNKFKTYKLKTNKKLNKEDDNADEFINIPYNITCPRSLVEFDELIDQYCIQDKVLSTVAIKELINRIIKWNKNFLFGAGAHVNAKGADGANARGSAAEEAAEKKSLLCNFMEILLKHFIRLGDSLAEIDDEDENENDDEEKMETEESNDVKKQSKRDLIFDQLNHLTEVFFNLIQILKKNTIKFFLNTIKNFYNQYLRLINNFSLSGTTSSTSNEYSTTCWLSLGKLLVFKLFANLFSCTDDYHDIIYPSSLILAQFLIKNPVRNFKELSSGLLVCSILLDYHQESNKYITEVTSFISSALVVFTGDYNEEKKEIIPASDVNSKELFFYKALESFKLKEFDHLRLILSEEYNAKINNSKKNKKLLKNIFNEEKSTPFSWNVFSSKNNLNLSNVLSSAVSSSTSSPSPTILKLQKESYIILNFLLNFIDLYFLNQKNIENWLALPEIINGIHEVIVKILLNKKEILFNNFLVLKIYNLAEKMIKIKKDIVTERKPLKWRSKKDFAHTELNNLTPKFELNYKFNKKNKGGDASKTADLSGGEDESERIKQINKMIYENSLIERKKLENLKKVLKKEKKNTIKELRKDSSFIAKVNNEKKYQHTKKLQEERHKNYAWMEEQLGTLNQQVKQGKGLVRGGGSGIVKGKRRK